MKTIKTGNVETTNNNAQLIAGMREAIEYLEAHPNFPHLGIEHLRQYYYSSEDFLTAAKAAGTFNKVIDAYSYTLEIPFGPRFGIRLITDRANVCKKVVKWECPSEGLLALMGDDDASIAE